MRSSVSTSMGWGGEKRESRTQVMKSNSQETKKNALYLPVRIRFQACSKANGWVGDELREGCSSSGYIGEDLN